MYFVGPINSRSFLVVVDAHSKWPEIFPMQNVDTRSTKAVLKLPFSKHGLLEKLVSDNATKFTSLL